MTDREELARLFYSFANPGLNNWDDLKDTLGFQSYWRGADRILESFWYKGQLQEAGEAAKLHLLHDLLTTFKSDGNVAAYDTVNELLHPKDEDENGIQS